MGKNIYRVNPNGGTICEPGGVFPPGTEIELDEERARSLGDSIAVDADGRAIVYATREGEPETKAIERPPEHKMLGKEKTTRKRQRKRK